MNFVSYAQNFEDVMLWRALKHVENGFYIDVGANDPTIHSVTKAFYERGWHGINIEPLPSHHADLVEARARDINLQCAAGAEAGEIEIWECDVRGWATASGNVISQHTANGHKGIFHKTPVFQLKGICAQYVTGEIHFLKIDVEGFEKSVIDGMDFSRFRPWIVVIEATKPNSTEEVHSEWENAVLSARYVLAYRDGLNRFYVANERSDLLSSLRHPPNIFDGFIRSEQFNAELGGQQAEVKAQQAEVKAQQAEAKVQQAEAKVQQAEAKVQQAEAKVQQAETLAQQAEAKTQQAEAASTDLLAQLQAVYASSSWKVTRPLRGIKRLLSGDLAIFGQSTAAAKLKVKQVLRPVVMAGIGYANTRPALRNRLKRSVSHFPWLRQRLVRVALNSCENSQVVLAGQQAVPLEIKNMTPRARQIYQDLKAAIENKNKGGA